MTISNTIRLMLTLVIGCLFLTGCGGGGDDVFFDDDFVDNDFINQPLPPVNNPGTFFFAQFDSYEAAQDAILIVDELFGVLANDEFPVFDTFVDYPFFTVQGGDLEGFQDGSFEYEPPPGFIGEDSFTYTLIDNTGRESSAQVFITVNPLGFRTQTEIVRDI